MSLDPHFSPSRRAFLKLSNRKKDVPVRPPWSDESSIAAHCTGCGDCAKGCPENIIVLDDHRRPVLNFGEGTCTFCGDCAKACPTEALDFARDLNWPWKAEIRDTCLSLQGVTCRTCEDVCEPRAIRFKLALGGKSAPLVDADQCTGCGACAHSCPVQAIRLKSHEPQPEKESA